MQFELTTVVRAPITMLAGRFRSFEHDHWFAAVLARYLRRLLRDRAELLREQAERHARV